MTLDPEMCRQLSAWADTVAGLKSVADLRMNLERTSRQLAAAADLHDQHEQAKRDILLQAARLQALESELATLKASVVDAMSAAGPEVPEDERIA